MSLTDLFASDLRTIMADIPAVIVVGGVTLSGTKGELARGESAELSGLFPEPQLEIVMAVSDLTEGIPSVGTTLTVDGVRYRIERNHEGQDGVSLRCDLRRV